MSDKIKKAMIFAAGMGSRLKPWTDSHPKALALVNGKPLLQRNIEYLKQFGIDDIIINVHHFAEQIISFLKQNENFGIQITISHEPGEPLETGGGLKKAKSFLEDANPFLVMNADILTDMDIREMYHFHQKHKPLATLAISERVSSRAFLFDKEYRLCGWRNNKTGEEKKPISAPDYIPFAFSGIHLIDPSIFSQLTEEGKFSIVDVYLRLTTSNEIMGFNHTGAKLIDVGKPESIAQAALLFP